MERNLCECAIRTVFSENVESLFSFKNTDIVIVYDQWETVIVERKEKNITEQPKRGVKMGTIEEVTEPLINLLTDFSIHNLKHRPVP